jgi:predicted MPP superfamily phosphohydrolase
MLFYESVVVALIAYCVLRGLSQRYSRPRALIAIGCAAIVVYGNWAQARFTHAPLGPLGVALAGTWIFCVLLALVVGLPWLLVRGLIRIVRRIRLPRTPEPEAPQQNRRDFLAAVAFPAVSLSLGAACSIYGANRLVVAQRTLHIRNWPRALDGFRIGQITDTHVGDFISPEWVAHAVGILNDAGVHLQVMTGDLLDDLYYLEPAFRALEQCQAPLGMLCVLGNHEKMHHRLPPILAAYRTRQTAGKIRLLVDESTVLEHNGSRLCVVGVDYPMHINGSHLVPKQKQHQLMRSSAARAFSAVDQTQALLCLSHHPDFFPLAQERRVHLTLSGHTHGGQLALFGRPLFTPYEFNLGHYEQSGSHLYVSGGTGHWLPLRYGVPMEVTVITLRSQS